MMDYGQLDTEVLGQMMQAAKRTKNIASEPFAALQKAVVARKQQIEAKLDQISGKSGNESGTVRLQLYQELISLEPDQYQPYFHAAWACRQLTDESGAAAYFTAALQLVGPDQETLAEIYKERSHSYLRLQEYTLALADGKMALRYQHLVQADPYFEKSYGPIVYLICESLRQLAQAKLANEIETSLAWAAVSDEGVTDSLIAEFFPLLAIPLETTGLTQPTQSADQPAPTSRLRTIQQSISSDPTEVRKRQLRKQFYEEAERNPNFALLLGILRELIRLEPTNYRYYAAAGHLCTQQQDFTSAVSYCTAAFPLVDQYPGDAWWQQEMRTEHLFKLYRLRAYAYASLHQTQKAMADYVQALRTKPNHRDAQNVMALLLTCYAKLGYREQIQEATTQFEQLFQDQPFSTVYQELEQGWVTYMIPFVEFSAAGTEGGELERTRRQAQQQLARLDTPQEQHAKAQKVEAARHNVEVVLTLLPQCCD